MKLAAYLAEHNITDADFGALIGVTRQAIHRYKTGERVPEWPVLAKIKEITSGGVSPDDFLTDPPQSEQSSIPAQA
jgi:transcriptional regulator with XRE-family HTH domain